MTLCVVAGSSNVELAAGIASGFGIDVSRAEVEHFPDGELRPVVGEVRGADVYIVQPTSPPVNDHLVELALLIDACRRQGAKRITAVVPYFGYARQDRRWRSGHGIGIRVALDVVAASGADRLVVVDPHTLTLEAMSPIPVVTLSATTVLTEVIRDLPIEPSVVVAPDFGALKLAERFGAALELPVAVIRKSRQSGALVRAEELFGHVDGRQAVIVDDMITSGATIEAAVELVNLHGGSGAVAVAVHGLFVGAAAARLDALELGGIVVTDTAQSNNQRPAGLQMVTVGVLLQEAIARLYNEESLEDLHMWG
jgi:ribose-phosphate pyrophosphokinase